MAATSWYNENRNRAFPFLAGGMDTVPLDAIVDAGFVLHTDSGFDSAADTVYLNQIWRVSNTFYFEFLTSSLGELWPLVFTRDVSDPDYTYEEVDEELLTESVSNSLSESEDYFTLCDTAPWSGYLVTGSMASLASWMAPGGSWTRSAGQTVVEPGLLYNQAYGFVTAINLANDDRTRCVAPAGCPPITWPYETGVVMAVATCLRDELVFMPGYNCLITQNPSDNSLTIAAGLKAGAGQPCDEVVPVFPGETPADGATNNLLDGSLRCSEVLRAINGIGGPALQLTAGNGVQITPDPDNNRLVVNVNMQGLAICYEGA